MLRHWLSSDVKNYVLRPMVQQPFITALLHNCDVFVIYLDGRPTHAQRIVDSAMLGANHPHWQSTMATQQGVIYTYMYDEQWKKLLLRPRIGDFEEIPLSSGQLAYGRISDTNNHRGAVCLNYMSLDGDQGFPIGLTDYTTGEITKHVTTPIYPTERDCTGLVVDDHHPWLLYGTREGGYNRRRGIAIFDLPSEKPIRIATIQPHDIAYSNMVAIADGLGILHYTEHAGNEYFECDHRLSVFENGLHVEIDNQCRWLCNGKYQRHLISNRTDGVYYVDPATMQLRVLDRRAARFIVLPGEVPMRAEIGAYMQNLTWHD